MENEKPGGAAMERKKAIREIEACLRGAMPAEEKDAGKADPVEFREVRAGQREHVRMIQLIDRIEVALRLILPGRRFKIDYESF